MKHKSLFILTPLLWAMVLSVYAQHPDTVYIVHEKVVHDTVFVHDTLHVCDSINIAEFIHSQEFEQLFYGSELIDNQLPADSLEKMLQQTVTFWENRVIYDEQQNFSNMDSIKKYGLAGLIILGMNTLSPAQTDSTTVGNSQDIRHRHPVFIENPFNGFHLGYTIQYDLIEPVLTNEVGGLAQHGHSKILHGFHAGLEFSYHFADYFGVSAGLNYGNIGSIIEMNSLQVIGQTIYKTVNQYGFSFPLKFEFVYPVSKNILFTLSAGARIRVPNSAFIQGFNETGFHGYSENYLERADLVYDNNTVQTDVLLDAGIYYRLPNEDYLRFTLGMNMATSDFMQGIVNIKTPVAIFDDESASGESTTFDVSHRNNHIYFQIAYIQSFNKQRKIAQARPRWDSESGMHHRHEVRFEVGDPFGIALLQRKTAEQTSHNRPIIAQAIESTPVFSLNYHYRLTKWFWAGAMINYGYYRDHVDYDNFQLYQSRWLSRWLHCITFMPELRFSYLNRPHATLYSGIAAGVTWFIGHHNLSWEIYDGQWWKLSTFPSFQLTAFGIRAGGEHLFGSFEAGFGIKGIVSAGIGYAF